VAGHGTQRLDDVTSARLFGLPGFRVLAAGEVGGELEVLIEPDAVTGCPSCGVVATAHGRRATLVQDGVPRSSPQSTQSHPHSRAISA
jgi:hypothetical protein